MIMRPERNDENWKIIHGILTFCETSFIKKSKLIAQLLTCRKNIILDALLLALHSMRLIIRDEFISFQSQDAVVSFWTFYIFFEKSFWLENFDWKI